MRGVWRMSAVVAAALAATLTPAGRAGESGTTVGGAGESASAAAAMFIDADTAYEHLRGKANWGQTVEPEALTSASLLIEEAAAREPKEAKWQKARAIALFHAKKWDDSRSAAEKAVALAPKDADAHYILGNACFNGIMDAGTLEQMSLASKGRKAYEKAIELDPKHADARFSMFMFYLQAPGIAGGSVGRARAQAREMLKIDGEQFRGYLMMGQAEAKDEEWDKAAAAFDLAEQAVATDVQRRWLTSTRARILLRDKKDVKAAMPYIERLITLGAAATPPDMGGYITLGDAKRELKDFAGAAEAYAKYLESEGPAPENPSPSARYGMAKVRQALGENEAAAAMYEEFLAKFPKDRRADDAKSELKKVRRALGRR